MHNQSVLKAVALIGCFVDDTEGKTLTELARRTGLNVSTAYRMLQSLVLTGMLRRLDSEERYVVGPLLMSLAGSTFMNGGYNVVLEQLGEVARETGESVSLGFRDGGCVAILLSIPSSHQLRFHHRSGDRLPIQCSAMGKVLLAGWEAEPSQVANELGRLIPMTQHSIVEPRILVGELREVQKRGYALSNEEHHLGVRSIAVPVGPIDGPVQAAIEVQAPTGRMDATRQEASLRSLRRVSGPLSDLPLLQRLTG